MNGILEIKKGKIRDFLLFCADLGNAVDKKDAKRIIEIALDNGVFSVPGDIEKTSSIAFMLEHQAELFMDEIETFAELMSTGKHFTVVLDLGKLRVELDRSYSAEVIRGQMSGAVEGKTIFLDQDDNVLKECPHSNFFDHFFDSFLRYADSRNIRPLTLPLGICLECDQIFFGRRTGQKFCSKDHGQLWRAREAYRVKRKNE